MKYDKTKIYPYPVLRPLSDDYLDGDFQATVDFIISGNDIEVSATIALSSEEIIKQIELGNAEYVFMISCRETYFQKIVKNNTGQINIKVKNGQLRGEINVNAYVVATKDIVDFNSKDINIEFGGGPFCYKKGELLAQDECYTFYADRDSFKPVTSVFDLVKRDDLNDGEWRINFDEDHIQIAVNGKTKQSIDNARNDNKNRIILLNSLYFAAVTQAVQKLKDNFDDFQKKKWAIVIKKQAHNNGLNLEGEESYLIAENLMKNPLSLLDLYVFKGDA